MDTIGLKVALKSLFAVLGYHSPELEQKLANALNRIYDEEMEYHQGFYRMARAIRTSLDAVQEVLGPPGMIDPVMVPEAAHVLGEYAEAFSRLEADCNFNALELQTSVDALKDRI